MSPSDAESKKVLSPLWTVSRHERPRSVTQVPAISRVVVEEDTEETLNLTISLFHCWKLNRYRIWGHSMLGSERIIFNFLFSLFEWSFSPALEAACVKGQDILIGPGVSKPNTLHPFLSSVTKEHSWCALCKDSFLIPGKDTAISYENLSSMRTGIFFFFFFLLCSLLFPCCLWMSLSFGRLGSADVNYYRQNG